MGRIRALLAPEVDFGIAVAGLGAGHRIGLWQGGLVIGGSVKARWLALIIVALRPPGLWPETPHRRPSLDQSAIDLEMIIRQKRRHLAMRQNGRHHFARHLDVQKPITVLGEDGGPSARGFARSGLMPFTPYRVVDAEAHKPAEQQVVAHLLH